MVLPTVALAILVVEVVIFQVLRGMRGTLTVVAIIIFWPAVATCGYVRDIIGLATTPSGVVTLDLMWVWNECKNNAEDKLYAEVLTVSFASTLSVGVQRTATPLAARWIHIFTLAIICGQLPVFALAIDLLYALTPNSAEAFRTSWLIDPDALSVPRSEVGPIWAGRGNLDLA